MCDHQEPGLSSEESEELFKRYYGWAFYRAVILTVNREDAFDLVQDVFQDLWRKGQIIFSRSDGEIRRFIYQALVWKRDSQLRRKRPEQLPENAPEPESNAPEPLEYMALEKLRGIVREAIQEIPNKRQRDVVWMSCIEGMSSGKIAAVLKISVEAVYKAKYEGLIKLKEILWRKLGLE